MPAQKQELKMKVSKFLHVLGKIARPIRVGHEL